MKQVTDLFFFLITFSQTVMIVKMIMSVPYARLINLSQDFKVTLVCGLSLCSGCCPETTSFQETQVATHDKH